MPMVQLPATTYASDLHGGYTMLHLELAAIRSSTCAAAAQMRYAIGENLRFDLDPEMVRFFHPETETGAA